MKILVFLHGTLIMHSAGKDVSREERVKQVMQGHPSVLKYEEYIPVGNAVQKLNSWHEQGAEIFYLSSHQDEESVEKDKIVLKKYNFSEEEVYFRKNGEQYSDVIKRILPDVLIEDDCESIGGEPEMTYPNLEDETKKKIKSIVVKEFQGIDQLPDDASYLN